MPRIFIALAIPPETRAHLSAVQGGIAGARWVPTENFHVTLRFIGEMTNPEVDDLIDTLSTIDGPPFELRLEGVGCFESKGRARSVWVGVDTSPALLALQSKVSRAVTAAGFSTRERRYHPHVTLARFSNLPVDRLGDFLTRQAGFHAEPFPVDAINIYESLTGRNGSVYRPVYEISFSSP